ncbi:phage head closure protein [Alkalimonas sp. NCh-2]|uniref:phage head closure protein n=1 Tax=Alkalimonas sp. NCh-2 TaxID=3144846 RepID=UPI0031F64D37
MRAGVLRFAAKLVSIDRAGRDESGEKLHRSTIQFTEIKTIRFGFLSKKQELERIANGKATPTNFVIQCRYDPRIQSTGTAIFYQGQHYEVKDVENARGMNRELIVTCEQMKP